MADYPYAKAETGGQEGWDAVYPQSIELSEFMEIIFPKPRQSQETSSLTEKSGLYPNSRDSFYLH
jgi:hypothetical protein